MLIEEADHELLNTLCHAQACVDFKPDLILLIDHYRAEFPGLPTQIPAVMWIQDLLPNIFNPTAGPETIIAGFLHRLRTIALRRGIRI